MNGRYDLFDQFYSIISDWKGQLPNLLDTFRKEEIECFLVDSIELMGEDVGDNRGKLIIEFVTRTGYRDKPDIDEKGKSLLYRTTPIHHATRLLCLQEHTIIRELFKLFDRFDLNFTDKTGCTHFHVACKFGCNDFVEKFLELGQDPNILEYSKGNSTLHYAMQYGHKSVAESLLRSGANPNLANSDGSTPLHILCMRGTDDELVELFFKINIELRQLVQVNVRDIYGNTPLHCTLMRGVNKRAVELLLRNAADPNLADKDRLTFLHIICKKKYEQDKLSKMLFEISNEMHQSVQVDAKNNDGQTPLHLALYTSKKKMIKLLLRKGAIPNLADQEKLTPLQWTVKKLKPQVIDVLLHYGADLSSFVFPAVGDFVCRWGLWHSDINFKLRLASDLLVIMSSLEKRGYELKRNDALTIMRLFAFYGFFKKSMDIQKCWHNNNELTSKVKKLMIKPNLSLYDLIHLRPEKAAKLLSYKDYFEFACSERFCNIPKSYRETYVLHMCEKLSRRFFRRWALDSFLELTRYRLPILCCDIIINNLKNEDLHRICLAASGQSSWWPFISIFVELCKS
uniref:Uncharacterized protein n=1 Tax=Trichogramma kaykai TaxID=54128 RepID=A0ABD2XA10_9HYME